MPAYRVEIQRAAERDLDRLAWPLRERVWTRFSALGADPRGSGVEKLSISDTYRVRVGDYRIVFAVDDRARIVVILRVRHRREVYRKLR